MQRRTQWLLAAMGLLAILRVWVPPGKASRVEDDIAVVPAIRPRTTADAGPFEPRSLPNPPTAQLHGVWGIDVAGDAFLPRVERAPVPAPPPRPVAAPALRPFVGPMPAPVVTLPPPPLAPPVQVIGTWDDGRTPGVFVSTPRGAVLARAGTLLLGEYEVTAVSAQQISLTHATSKHQWQLPVPSASGP